MRFVARGCVVRTLGETLLVTLPGARVGEGVRVHGAEGPIGGYVTAVQRGRAAVAPLGALAGVAAGDRVETASDALACVLGYGVLGRAIDATGAAIDGGPPARGTRVRVDVASPSPAERSPVAQPLRTRVFAIDALLTIGRGARIGIFGGPGSGKSTLLETIVRRARADAVVVALVGERGREAQAWLERVDARTTIVCATSDRSAAERIRAAEVAMAQATLLRARGYAVLLVVDSLARYCAALRERRLAAGETTGRGGYPPGVFADLARYVERAGTLGGGSVTLLATVLSDGGDEREPLSDAARSLLDGHITLSAELARGGHHPAIDIPASISRTMSLVVDRAHLDDAARVRAALALLERTKDARLLGFADTNDPALQRAVAMEPLLVRALCRHDALEADAVRELLRDLAAGLVPAGLGLAE